MIGWIVLISVILLVFWAFRTGPDDRDQSGFEEPEALEIQDFTPNTLQKYNGIDDERVLLAIKGKVFDVTNGKAHYGPSGPYASFAGRDASRGLAKHSFDENMLTPLDKPIDPLTDLSESERDALTQWEQFFESKYTYCGRLINP